ncbi:transmembrane protein 199 isoform X2 [Pantherophis guttatus]|nr:transmembrane protein 199 isoform X2 [Pantherophis guttatus]XP_060550398.1 transmembrane protein 199 isoform X2 [Pantherophis guttatus]
MTRNINCQVGQGSDRHPHQLPRHGGSHLCLRLPGQPVHLHRDGSAGDCGRDCGLRGGPGGAVRDGADHGRGAGAAVGQGWAPCSRFLWLLRRSSPQGGGLRTPVLPQIPEGPLRRKEPSAQHGQRRSSAFPSPASTPGGPLSTICIQGSPPHSPPRAFSSGAGAGGGGRKATSQLGAAGPIACEREGAVSEGAPAFAPFVGLLGARALPAQLGGVSPQLCVLATKLWCPVTTLDLCGVQ